MCTCSAQWSIIKNTALYTAVSCRKHVHRSTVQDTFTALFTVVVYRWHVTSLLTAELFRIYKDMCNIVHFYWIHLVYTALFTAVLCWIQLHHYSLQYRTGYLYSTIQWSIVKNKCTVIFTAVVVYRINVHHYSLQNCTEYICNNIHYSSVLDTYTALFTTATVQDTCTSILTEVLY